MPFAMPRVAKYIPDLRPQVHRENRVQSRATTAATPCRVGDPRQPKTSSWNLWTKNRLSAYDTCRTDSTPAYAAPEINTTLANPHFPVDRLHRYYNETIWNKRYATVMPIARLRENIAKG